MPAKGGLRSTRGDWGARTEIPKVRLDAQSSDCNIALSRGTFIVSWIEWRVYDCNIAIMKSKIS